MAANLPRPSVDENISTTLSSGITDVAVSMDVADASKIVSPCYLVIDRVDSSGTLKATSLWEYVKVTNVAGNTLTITRAQGGSTGQAHGSGAVVEAVITSSMFEDWYSAINPEHDANGGHVIVGTMTVAGMNLASVATIASLGVGVARVLTQLNVSGASITGIFASGASGALLMSQGNTLLPVYTSNAVSTDGWTSSSDTWVYASASTFTIAGVDRTAIYTKGTKLKFTNTTLKYAVVVSSAFGTDTTVTIAVNTDYVIANAAISANSYSYQDNPQSFPTKFAFTPSMTGFSANPTGTFAYAINGGQCIIYFGADTPGTSNATGFTITVPIAAAAQTYGISTTHDNGTWQSTPGRLSLPAGTTLTVSKDAAGTVFTGSGNKTALFQFSYAI